MVQMYPERESKSLDFKVTPPKFSKLYETCVAFANGAGGQIIIGVEDASRKIIGINEEIRTRIYDEFSSSLYDVSSPGLIPHIYEKKYGDKSVLIIQIFASNKKPCFIKSKGNRDGVYIRVGANTKKADDHTIEELYRENKRINYEEESIIDLGPKELEADKIKNYYQKKVNEKRLIVDKFLKESNLTNNQSKPSIAGILLFNSKPDEYIPEALIRCTRFAGNSGRNIIQSEEIRGSIDEQVEQSYKLVQSWISRNYQLQGTKMKFETLIPEEALREAITNAVIHRKYSIAGAIKIAVYEDHMEIFSPGALPDIVNINNLGDGTSYARNPVLIRAFRKLGLVESLGSGVRLILDSCKAKQLKEPEYIEDGDYVKVIFSFEKIKLSSTDDFTAIKEFLQEKQSATIQELSSYLGVSRNTVTRKLNSLIEQNKVIRIGQTRSTRFQLHH